MSNPNEQEHRQAVTGWARQFALIRRQLPSRESQDKLQELWRAVRDALGDQHREIIQIRTLALAQSLDLPSRPPTSNSVAECREAVGRALEEAAGEIQDASNTIRVLQNIHPQWVRDFLVRRYKTPNCISPLGCWICNLQPGHPNGYIKINLRNTVYQPPNASGAQRELGIQPWLHQLVVVGKGQGGMLPLTTGAGGYEVSLQTGFCDGLWL